MKQIKSQFKRTVGFICIFLNIITCGIFITSCSPIEVKDIINSLMPNVWVFIAHIIASIVLIVILFWLVYKPVQKAIEKRNNFINQQINSANDTKKQADLELAKANNLKEKAISDATAITTTAENKASQIISTAKSNAKEEAKQIEQRTNIKLIKQEKQMRKKIHDEIVKTAFFVAEEVLKKEIAKNDKKEYIDNIMKSIEKDLKHAK